MDQIFGGLIPNQPEQDRPAAGPQCAEAVGPDREVRGICSLLGGRPGRAGSFGLIHQFGVGVDIIDLEAAADEVAWVANMPGLNAVPVAEHAVALLLAPARRLPEASKGFEPGRASSHAPTEPYPADAPLVTHPRIVATALTSDYFAAPADDSAPPSPAISIISRPPDS